MAKLNYYVELEKGNPSLSAHIEPRNPNRYYTRAEFAKDYGRYVMVNGINFKMEQVRAEPQKVHSMFEIIFCILITSALLYFVPDADYHLPKWRWAVAIGLAWIVGLLIGRLRIGFQQADADYFNKS